MRIICILILLLAPAGGMVAPPGDPEEVKLDYELFLNRCKGDSCHSESVAHGEVYIFLEKEDPTYSWGYSAIEQQAGSLAYQLRFKRVASVKGKEA